MQIAMANRLRRIYLLSLLLTHLQITYLTVTLTSSPFAPLLYPTRFWLFGYHSDGTEGPGLLAPTSLLATLFVWSLGVLPLLVAAKWCVSSGSSPKKPSPAAAQDSIAAHLASGSPASHIFSSLRSSRTWASVFLGALCAGAYAVGLWACLTLYSPKDSTAWDVRLEVPKRPGHFRPNEHVGFLLISSVLFAAIYALVQGVLLPLGPRRSNGRQEQQQLPLGWWPLQWPVFSVESIDQTISTRLFSFFASPSRGGPLGSCLAVAVVLSASLLGTYSILRPYIFNALLRTIGLRSPLRALLIPSFRHAFLTSRYALTLACVHASMAASWSVAHALWAVYATQPVQLSGFAKDPTRCLTQGLTATSASTSSSTYYRQYAFAELAVLVRSNAARRKAILRDLGSGAGGAGAGGARRLLVRPLASATGAVAAAEQSDNSSLPSTSAGLSSPMGTPRRAANIAGTAAGNAWNVVVGQCLEVLETQKAWAKRMGAPPAAPKTAAAKAGGSVGTTATAALSGKTRNLLRQSETNIVQPVKPSIWDRLAAEAKPKPAGAGTGGVSASSGTATSAGKTVPSTVTQTTADVWHQIAPSQLGGAPQGHSIAIGGSARPATVASSMSQASPPFNAATLFYGGSKLLSAAWGLIPSSARARIAQAPVLRLVPRFASWTFSSSPVLQTRYDVLQDRAASVQWASAALAGLASASLAEDEYGVVQKDLPALLVCFAETIQAMDRWGAALRKQAVASGLGDADAQARQQAWADEWSLSVLPTQSILRNGLQSVLAAFDGLHLDLQPSEWELVRSVVHAPAVDVDPIHSQPQHGPPQIEQTKAEMIEQSTASGPEMRQVSGGRGEPNVF